MARLRCRYPTLGVFLEMRKELLDASLILGLASGILCVAAVSRTGQNLNDHEEPWAQPMRKKRAAF